MAHSHFPTIDREKEKKQKEGEGGGDCGSGGRRQLRSISVFR